MAEIVNIAGPDPKGNYQAELKDGNKITFGPCTNPAYSEQGWWFVSLEGKPHSTFILNMWDRDVVVQAIHAKGAEKELWERVAVQVTHGLWNV